TETAFFSVNGNVDSATIRAIKLFQAAAMKDNPSMADPFSPEMVGGVRTGIDGRVDMDSSDLNQNRQAIDWLNSQNAPRWKELIDDDLTWGALFELVR